MNNESTPTSDAASNIVGFFLLVPFMIALRGYVIMRLWAWFVVTTFSLPQLRLPVAAGLATLCMVMTGAHTSRVGVKTEKTKDTLASLMVTGILINLLVLGFGYVLHQF